MSRIEVWGRERPDQNRDAAWPFADRATLRTTGGLEIPRGAFLDAKLTLGGSTGPVALRSIGVAAGLTSIRFGDAANPAAGIAEFDPNAIDRRLRVVNAAGTPIGLLVVDPATLGSLGGWSAGEHAFPAGSADLAAAAVNPSPTGGVVGVAAGTAPPLAGEVWLVGRDGIVLSVDADANAIRVDVAGDPLWKRKLCGGEDFQSPNYLRTINAVQPTPRGEFWLMAAGIARGQTILRIEPDGTSAARIYLAGH